jgi:hypothetical protein
VIKSIHVGSTDVLRGGLTVSGAGKISLEIVLAPDGGQIDGVVLDKDDKPMAGATVILVRNRSFATAAIASRTSLPTKTGATSLKTSRLAITKSSPIHGSALSFSATLRREAKP